MSDIPKWWSRKWRSASVFCVSLFPSDDSEAEVLWRPSSAPRPLQTHCLLFLMPLLLFLRWWLFACFFVMTTGPDPQSFWSWCNTKLCSLMICLQLGNPLRVLLIYLLCCWRSIVFFFLYMKWCLFWGWKPCSSSRHCDVYLWRRLEDLLHCRLNGEPLWILSCLNWTERNPCTGTVNFCHSNCLEFSSRIWFWGVDIFFWWEEPLPHSPLYLLSYGGQFSVSLVSSKAALCQMFYLRDL